MISIEEHQKLLLNIARRLKEKITAYAIGGNALMFLGIKDSTLDIDLVFENEKDKNLFKEALKEIGYVEMDSCVVYGRKNNPPEMLTLLNERFDLFVEEVIDFIFSDTMRKRAVRTYQFGENLMLKIADPHDIILMKCATERVKDMDDVRKIMELTNIDWKVVIEEAKKQMILGKERAAFDLGFFLEKLKKIKKDIPQKIIDELFEIVKKQAGEKRKEKARKRQ